MAATIVRGALTVAALAAVLLLVTLPRTDAAIATWPDAHPWLGPVDRVAGAALVMAGIGAWWVLRPAVVGACAVLAGMAWLAAGLVGTPTASDAWRSVAWLMVPFLLPFAAVLVIRAASVGPLTAGMRRLLVLLVAGTLALSVARALTFLPADDPRCWTFCSPAQNMFALTNGTWTPVHRAVTVAWGLLAVAGWSGLSAWVIGRPSRTWRTGRAGRSLLAGGVILGVTSALWMVVALWTKTDPPSPFGDATALIALWMGRAVGLLSLAAGVAGLVVTAWRRKRAMRRIMAAMEAAPAPGALAATLRATLGDAALTVTYVLDDGRCVDATGTGVPAPTPGASSALTTIERGGVPIAIVTHDAALDGPMLIREIGAAARLAVDNERLRAAVLTRVADLRASQTRIVAVADDERRRLERDLHDGAQQRLLALSFDIRVARAAAERAGQRALTDRLSAADEVAQAAIAELRRLAHGIFPAILRDTGLAPALATLADDAPLPVELDLRFRGRCGPSTEVAAYHVVADALLHATRAGASHLAVRLERAVDTLVVDVTHDGVAVPGSGVRMADRIGAVGGRLAPVPGPDAHVRVELPCA